MFLFVFLAVFGTIDVVVWRYETTARAEFDRAPDHPVTWQIVAEQWPWSYVACRARALILREGLDLQCYVDPPAARLARRVSRELVAPGLSAVGLPDLAAAVAACEYDALRTAYTSLAASLFGVVVALYLVVAFWRPRPPAWTWRLSLLGGALALFGFAWARAIAGRTTWLEPAFRWTYTGELEMLLSLFLALVAFCLVFYRARPTPRIVRG